MVRRLSQSPVSPVAALRVRTLGGFAVWRGAEQIPGDAWARRKVLALFTCLLGAPGYRRHREELIDTLWPDGSADAGANNLRVTLHRLRAILDAPGTDGGYVRAEGEVLALAPFAGGRPGEGTDAIWLDAAAFAHAATAALAGKDLDACRAARVLYTGTYLPDILYEDWIEARREELRQQYLALVLHGARLSAAAGDDEETASWLEAILAHDRCHEQAARSLIRLLARGGRRAEALRVYERLATALAADLGQAPEAKTEALMESVRRLSPPVAAAPGPAGAVTTAGDAASPLPVGTVTFLMTDVEGSTALWERQPAAMRDALARHDALIDAALARYGGRQIKERGEGDSIFAVFAAPSAALAAACAIGQAMLAEPWPASGGLRVRVGIHTGEAELQDGGYYGSAVNRTARIRSLGHGGQILISDAAQAMVRDALPDGVALRALGRFALKGFERPEEVYQVLHPALPADFPPPAGGQDRAGPLTNLPAPVNRLVGRERERDEVGAALAGARLVTLVGPGGAGKTRLALAVAADLVPRYPEGVWLVELAGLQGSTTADAAPVALETAAALGLREDPARPILATLIEHLAARRVLLVLDNCEHLVAACATLADALLRACPDLRILASSRERLGVAGERGHQVAPLAVPDPEHASAPETLVGYSAVELFMERARERRPGFELTAQNGTAIARICARLDGIPLAIELAAARIGALPVESIAARLDDRFRLLTGGPRTATPRQQTLRGALDWSYDLLGEPERALLRRLAVFAGGWTLEAAETVCAGDGLEDWLIVDLLDGLANRSLALLEEPRGEIAARYRLLETVRQYAAERLGAERLGAADEAGAVRARHIAWCLRLAEEADAALGGPDQAAWLARLEAEHDNMRAALSWGLQAGSGDVATLAGALWRFWRARGHVREGRRWLQEALAHAEGATPIRARVLSGAAALAAYQGDAGPGRRLYEECLAIQERLGDRQGSAATLRGLGLLAHDRGAYAEAEALHAQSLALCRKLGDEPGIATSLSNLAGVVEDRGDLARAQGLYEEYLAMARRLGDQWDIAAALGNLGIVARRLGDAARAEALFKEGLGLFRQIGDRTGIAEGLAQLGLLAQMHGDVARATALLQEGLTIHHDVGDSISVGLRLEQLAVLAAQAAGAGGDRPMADRAARLFGAAAALRESLEAPLTPEDQERHERGEGQARAVLGDTAFAAAWSRGHGLAAEAAVAEALSPPGERRG